MGDVEVSGPGVGVGDPVLEVGISAGAVKLDGSSSYHVRNAAAVATVTATFQTRLTLGSPLITLLRQL